MASGGGGVPNSKQPGRGKKPYDRRTSIVGRMRETMKDMMSPSWLVDLIHSVRKHPHHPQDHRQDHHPQAAQPMNNIGQQPAASRNETVHSEVRNIQTVFVPINQATASGSSLPGNRTATFTSTDNSRFSHVPTMPPQVAGQSSCMSGPTGYSNPPPTYTRPPPEYTPAPSGYTQPKCDDQSEVSEYSISTSGCSSLVPHPDQRDYQRDILQLSESRIAQMRQELGGSVTPSKEIDPPSHRRSSVSDGRTVTQLPANNKCFLWSSEVQPSRSSRPQPPAKSQRPSFNVSIFGSPVQGASTRRHELGKDYQQSPYYPGKTTFGGAASHRKSRLQHSSPYHSPLVKRQVTARPLNNSTLGGVTSSTAKRILDTLEKMSTPIKDAKKIPSYNSSLLDSSLPFTPSNYRRRSLPVHNIGDRSISQPPPVASRAPPTMASTMMNRQGPSALSTPHLPLQSMARPPATQGEETVRDGGARTGKMRRERGQHYTSKKADDEVELPALPTSFTLPIGAMPSISFGSSVLPGSSTSSTSQPTRLNAVPDRASDAGSPLFKFSSPIVKERVATVPTSPTSPRSFQFSSPISVDPLRPSPPDTTRPSLPPTSSPSLAYSYDVDSVKLKRKSQPSTALSPEAGGFSAATRLAAGSVMDFLSKSGSGPKLNHQSSASSASVSGDLSSLFKKPVGSWECPTCLIHNQAPVTKCVACNTSKPSSTPTTSTVKSSSMIPGPSPGSQDIGSLFKVAVGSWECPMCMIRNKPDVTTCVACATTKPRTNNSQVTATSNTEKVPTPGDGNSLAAMFKRPPGCWECPTCMVQNGATHDICPACNSARPDTHTKSADKPLQLPASSEPSLADQFAKPPGVWECETCMVTNKAQSNKCIACETPRPGSNNTSNFTSPGGFKFGTSGGLVLTSATNSAATSGAPVFSFGSSAPASKPSDTNDKPVDGGFKFGHGSSAATDFSSSSGFKFGQPPSVAASVTGSKSNDTSNVLPSKSTEDLARTSTVGSVQFGQSPVPSSSNSNSFQLAAASASDVTFGTAAPSSGNAAKTNETPATSSTPGASASTTGLFQFDKTPSSTALGSNGVKFGESVPDTAKRPGETLSSFGDFTEAHSSASASREKQTPAAGEFSFGQSVSVTPDVSQNDTTVPAKGGFQFGASTTTAPFTNPLASSSDVKVGGFSFGGSTKTTATKSQSDNAASGFSFGGAATTSETKTATGVNTVGGFSFGGATKTSETKTASGVGTVGGFSFGGAQKTSETEASSGSAVGGFSFGGATKTSETKPASGVSTAGGFSFGASTKTSHARTETGGFSFGASTKTSDAKSAADSGTFKFGGSSASGTLNSPMVMSPGTPVVGGFSFSTEQTTTATQAADPSKVVFGSSSSLAPSQPQTGGFVFGATTAPPCGTEASSAGSFAFAGGATSAAPSKPQRADGGFAFRKRTMDDDANFAKRSKGFGGGGGGFVFGGAPTTTTPSTSASPFGAGTSGFGAGTSGFGAAPSTFGAAAPATFNPPAFGATTSAAPATGSMFAATPASFGAAATTAATKASFQFGATAPAATSGMFAFGGAQPTQSTAAPKPSEGFAFGGQAQPTPLGVAAPQQAAPPSFNFGATPNMNFGATTAAPFQFGAPPGSAPVTSNSFSINRAPASGGITNRKIKRAVRKIRK